MILHINTSFRWHTSSNMFIQWQMWKKFAPQTSIIIWGQTNACQTNQPTNQHSDSYVPTLQFCLHGHKNYILFFTSVFFTLTYEIYK